jgi:hypothetical protein
MISEAAGPTAMLQFRMLSPSTACQQPPSLPGGCGEPNFVRRSAYHGHRFGALVHVLVGGTDQVGDANGIPWPSCIVPGTVSRHEWRAQARFA